MDKQYLYGASIQGIQEYIFRTNKLRDVVGKSDTVNDICSIAFNTMFGDVAHGKVTPIVMAAGNVKCFLDEADCKKAVREFPKIVQDMAPGITFSQAVVKIEGEYSSFEVAVQELERRLRAQHNRVTKSFTMGLIGIERNRRTGLPLVKASKRSSAYRSTLNLYKKLFGQEVKNEKLCLDTENITDQNNWIAIIHADGNGLGEVVAQVGKDSEKLRSFSRKLNEATIAAASTACKGVFRDEYSAIRPVVIGGDDLTVICRASKAVEFMRIYLDEFEKETKQRLHTDGNLLPDGMECLTACAGIAFIKSSYPFYYGYNLAEELCGMAKKDAKSKEIQGQQKIAPSCLMFHKVQSSFVESYRDIVRKELTPCTAIGDDDKEHSWVFGPYYLTCNNASKENGRQAVRWTIDKLLEQVDRLGKEENNMAKTDIREWMTLMVSPERAAQKSKRVNSIGTNINKELFNEATREENRGGCLVSPAYDIMTLLTMSTQVTKSHKTKEGKNDD